MLPRFELVVTAEAEVVTVAEKLAALRALCAERQTEAVGGGMVDADTVWPSEILAILDGVL